MLDHDHRRAVRKRWSLRLQSSSHILKYYKDLTVEGNVAINLQHLHDFTFLFTNSDNLGTLLSTGRVVVVTSDLCQGNGIL